ncbi:MAG: TIGR00266 family protein [Campylobacterota bacterium]|nr:TIGR00266 family protein [Campylobacterota bacterium]
MLKRCDEVDYEIMGNDLQVVEVELDPDETVIAEAGAMVWMEQDISFEAKMGDGSNPESGFISNLFSGIGRMITGESLFMTHFSHKGRSGKRKVAFASSIPGRILDIDLSTSGGEILCQKDSFLCAAKGTSLEIALQQKLGAGFFGGEGFILQRIKGDGMVFLQAGGTQVIKELEVDEVLRVDTGCVTAFTPEVDFSIARAGNLKSMIFGGEGIFLATLKGPGMVVLQSLPFSKLADRIYSVSSHNIDGSSQGQSTGIGNMFER